MSESDESRAVPAAGAASSAATTMAASASYDIREMSFQNVVDNILRPSGIKMGGFPEEMFLDLSETEQQTFMCNICYLIANDGRVCDNKHLFCHSCILAWSMTFGENSQKCPMCRCEQAEYQVDKDIEDQLTNKRVRCLAEGCSFKAPLRIFLMHSHGKSSYSNASVDFEQLRSEQRPHFFVIPSLVELESETGATGRTATIREQLLQGRMMIHQMMLLMHLEMQLRQQALTSYQEAQDPTLRLQRLDDVMALNEQLNEVGGILSTLLSAPLMPQNGSPTSRVGRGRGIGTASAFDILGTGAGRAATRRIDLRQSEPSASQLRGIGRGNPFLPTADESSSGFENRQRGFLSSDGLYHRRFSTQPIADEDDDDDENDDVDNDDDDDDDEGGNDAGYFQSQFRNVSSDSSENDSEEDGSNYITFRANPNTTIQDHFTLPTRESIATRSSNVAARRATNATVPALSGNSRSNGEDLASSNTFQPSHYQMLSRRRENSSSLSLSPAASVQISVNDIRSSQELATSSQASTNLPHISLASRTDDTVNPRSSLVGNSRTTVTAVAALGNSRSTPAAAAAVVTLGNSTAQQNVSEGRTPRRIITSNIVRPTQELTDTSLTLGSLHNVTSGSGNVSGNVTSRVTTDPWPEVSPPSGSTSSRGVPPAARSRTLSQSTSSNSLIRPAVSLSRSRRAPPPDPTPSRTPAPPTTVRPVSRGLPRTVHSRPVGSTSISGFRSPGGNVGVTTAHNRLVPIPRPPLRGTRNIASVDHTSTTGSGMHTDATLRTTASMVLRSRRRSEIVRDLMFPSRRDPPQH